MTDVVSTWPVVVALSLRAEDRDGDGVLTDVAIERLFAEGRDAYAAHCPELDLPSASVQDLVTRRGAVAAPGGEAIVGVAVVEVFPERFTMDLRIRPAEGVGIAGSATCSVVPPDGVDDALKARLIALAQAARHHH